MSRERDRWVDGQRQTAGLVPLLNGKVVLISNRKDPNKWGLPKGGWEEWEPNAEDAAVREAFEEAGVRGISGGPLAPAEMTSKSGGHSVKVFWFASYVSEMLDEWPEGRERKRTVVGIDEAIKLVHRPEHRKALVEVDYYCTQPRESLAYSSGVPLTHYSRAISVIRFEIARSTS